MGSVLRRAKVEGKFYPHSAITPSPLFRVSRELSPVGIQTSSRITTLLEKSHLRIKERLSEWWPRITVSFEWPRVEFMCLSISGVKLCRAV